MKIYTDNIKIPIKFAISSFESCNFDRMRYVESSFTTDYKYLMK